MTRKHVFIILIALSLFLSCKDKDTADFMGSRSCKTCHDRFYHLWESSHHGRAMMDFNKAFADAHLTPCDHFIPVGNDAFQYRQKGSRGVMIERSSKKAYPIRHVLGGKYVFYFLTPLEKGKLQTLPLGYDIKRKEWFDITSSSIRVHQDITDEALPWTDRRYTFNTACFSCHVSQLTTEYDLKDDSYQTSWLEPGINCETCHGPADEHNRIFEEAAKTGITPDSMYIKTYTQSRGASAAIVNATCSYCHAKSIPLTSGYVMGEDFFQHYDLVGPEHHDFYPDGRDLGENYTYTTWLMSPCVRNSDMDCLHCHTSSGRFRQKDDPNAACLPCHQDRVEHATEHTHHAATSTGNICINCHMPKTTFARMDRSDHSMRPPVPAATRAYGSPNACNDCHSTESPEWAESFILEHFSGKYQQEHMRWANDLDQLRRGDASHLTDILTDMIRPVDEVTLSALLRSLQNVRDGRIVTLAYYFMMHDSPLVRSSAATVLGDYDEEIARTALIRATRDSIRLVRIRAAAELLDIPMMEIPMEFQKSVANAIDEYEHSLTAYPDQESTHFNLGYFHESRSENRKAISDYRHALELRPEFTEASVNLGVLYYQSDQIDSALYFLEQAVRLDPDHAQAALNLGLLYSELGRHDNAIRVFTQSFDNNNSAVAAYNLSVLYSTVSTDSTLKYAGLACRISPDETKYVYTYAFYLSQYGKTNDAIDILETALSRHIGSFDIYYLLGSIYKYSGDMNALEKLKKMIAKDKDISEKERQYLTFN